MIFVTVGTTNFKFNRLFSSLDRALVDLKSGAKLVAQVGESDYKWKYKNVVLKRYLSPKEMSFYCKNSNRIISHGGFGSLFLLSDKAKVMPLIVARLKKFREHVNDHQKDFLMFIRRKIPNNLKRYFICDEFISEHILVYLKHKPEYNYTGNLFSKENKRLLIEHLYQYINHPYT